MVEPTRVECQACEQPASHLNYRVNPEDQTRHDMRACKVHNDLACEYKAAPIHGRSSPADETKKELWLLEASKPEARDHAAVLLSPDRDGEFHSRRLNHRERYVAQDTLIQRDYPGRTL